jgi:hypothetical protein
VDLDLYGCQRLRYNMPFVDGLVGSTIGDNYHNGARQVHVHPDVPANAATDTLM